MKVQTLCTDGARPRRPHCNAQPGDAPTTRLFADSEREAELFGSTLQKHLGGLFIFTQGDDDLQRQGSRPFWARMLEHANVCAHAGCLCKLCVHKCACMCKLGLQSTRACG